MSFNLPISLESDVRQFAEAERLTVDEAAATLIRSGLKAGKRKVGASGLTEADWDKLQELDPGFTFFESMPDTLIDHIETASKRKRSERLRARA